MRGDVQARSARLPPAPVRVHRVGWPLPGRRWQRQLRDLEELEMVERLRREGRSARQTSTPALHVAGRPWY